MKESKTQKKVFIYFYNNNWNYVYLLQKTSIIVKH